MPNAVPKAAHAQRVSARAGWAATGSRDKPLMGTSACLLGKPCYVHDFPGLSIAAIHRLAERGIGMFGAEAISPVPEGKPNFKAHMACAERGITHMKCPANLESVMARGRCRFIGLPLEIKGGTASPIRAVAVFE